MPDAGLLAGAAGWGRLRCANSARHDGGRPGAAAPEMDRFQVSGSKGRGVGRIEGAALGAAGTRWFSPNLEKPRHGGKLGWSPLEPFSELASFFLASDFLQAPASTKRTPSRGWRCLTSTRFRGRLKGSQSDTEAHFGVSSLQTEAGSEFTERKVVYTWTSI